MKKLQKNMMILFSLLFINQSSHASCITRLSGSSLVIGGVYVIGLSSQFNKDDSIDAQMFPHSVEWYKNLAIKYPEAHLDQKEFRAGFTWGSQMNNIIMADSLDLNQIEKLASIQKDQSLNTCKNNEDIQEKIQYVAELEAIVLHEAGHLEHKHHQGLLISSAASIILLETCYQAYMKKHSQKSEVKSFSRSLWNFTKSIPRRIGLFVTMTNMHGLIMAQHSQKCEKQADAFVCKHADLPALHGYKQHFEDNISRDKKSLTNNFTYQYFSTHPSNASRLAAIQQEIARRELAQIK